MSDQDTGPRQQMPRMPEFPEIDREPGYRRQPRHRSGAGVGRFLAGIALLLLGAAGAYSGIVVFGDRIPGIRLAASQEENVPVAPVDVPENSTIALQARTWGVNNCLAQIVNIEGFLTQRTNSDEGSQNSRHAAGHPGTAERRDPMLHRFVRATLRFTRPGLDELQCQAELRDREQAGDFRTRVLKIVERVLQIMPESERLPFLTLVEEKVGVEGDLAGLRLVRDSLQRRLERTPR